MIEGQEKGWPYQAFPKWNAVRSILTWTHVPYF